MSLGTLVEDDDFDWEAAVAEIDKVCSKVEEPVAGAGIQSSQPQSSQKLKQKTLDSFIREGKGSHKFNDGKQPQKIWAPSAGESWNQGHQSHNGNQHRKSSVILLKKNGNEGPRINNGKQPVKRSELFSKDSGYQGHQSNSRKQHQEGSTSKEHSFRQHANQGNVQTSGSRIQQDYATESVQGSRCEVPFDPVAARSWIYPANVPCRTYQFNITKVALFSNTLVSLPTGLGKTLIAAAVMYNYFRWFPTGKIIFAAPSRPLVVQQIEACHKVVGIPQDMTIDMTGEMSPPVRAENWQSKRVFFVTPQCLEKDIQAGTCALKQIVCLVLDEAHRATGNYSYCVIVRQLFAAKINYRLLALTATPGSKQITIQAVVDNLHISCLEYRNEDDPDVSQYTHNRKIELIEVPMNAESNQAKDLLVEILQPIVYRLCGFRVFYNREIARLTPFEFIQAREKFRQAPPPTIPQNEYSQVEMYFGLAITLTHIFKLLFTHGMRPAYEMFQQKLQQGVLKRLQGNERVRHLQSVMKQTVGHGAPSPKLEKVVEIISSHFRAHDPINTRVIIFTNFRESVKDIMEILAAKCTDVKAMEFIGQSSGKASKGQSQKTQQAVLQKFRAGGFNTIVATSIAEEGLDIMEVDLVICFDANISPLRMIQRMGRTGRKRDGRVVVLACEGAEKEGYLTKQSKNKALKKHMVNGGVFSFNFHPSSHMIPHSFRPEVLLLELAIDDFVPRTKKAKAKQSEVIVGVLRSLSEEELQLLEKYRVSSREELWRPSLIAFPQYQVIPTPVHRVKHSYRTSVMIDALRSLQETSAQVIVITQNPVEDKVNTAAETMISSFQEHSIEAHETSILSCTPEKNDTVHEEQEVLPSTSSHDLKSAEVVHVDRLARIIALNAKVKSASQHAISAATTENLATSRLEERREVRINKDFQQHLIILDLDEAPPVERCRLAEDVEEFTDVTGEVNQTVTDDKNVAEFVNTTMRQETHYPAMDEPLLEENILTQVIGSHRCKYSNGVVHTTESGLIILASPPSFPSGKSHRKRFTTSRGHTKENMRKPLSYRGTSSSGSEVAGGVLKSMPTVKLNAMEAQVKSQGVASLEIPVAEGCQNGGVDAVSPNYKPPQVEEACTILGREQLSGIGVEKVTSRLDVIASQGVVPSSPVAEPLCNHGHLADVLSTPYGFKASPDDVQQPENTPMNSVVQHQSSPATPVSSTLGINLSRRHSLGQIELVTTTGTKSKKTPLSSFLCRINGKSPPKGKLLRFSEDCPDSVSKDASVSSTNEPQITRLEKPNLQNAIAFPITTPQGRSHKSPSEDWQITEGKGSASVQRPRKLKRLCKVGEKSKRSSATPKSKQKKKVGDEGFRGSKSSRSELKEVRNKRKLLVRNFFDEEAEVSEDDESSDQYDSEEDAEDEVDGFIDSAGTQHLKGTVDMMGVYRRSLLTQSPADLVARYGHLLGTSPSICSDGTPGSSDDISASTASVVPGSPSVGPVDELSPARIDSDGKKPFLDKSSRFIQSTVATAEAGNILPSFSSTVVFEDQRKLELRKRKLSFQANTDTADVSEPSCHRLHKKYEPTHKVESVLQQATEPLATRPADSVKETIPVVEFEDDLFDGVDLDALEAEAAQTCRIRSQKVVNSSYQEAGQNQELDVSSFDSKAQLYGGTIASKPRPLPRFRKDDYFGSCPSFDLGLAD